MSLINDALKRAGQQGNPPPGGGSGGGTPPPPMRPANGTENSPFPFIPVLLVVIFCLAGLFFYLGIKSRSGQSAETRQPVKPGLAQNSVLVTNAAKPILTASAPAPATTTGKPKIKISTNIVIRTNYIEEAPVLTNAPVAVAAAPAPELEKKEPPTAITNAVPEPASTPAPVALKLQGIFYRQTNPSAMINNRTVIKGSVVEGSKVTAIEREHVVLEKGGVTNILHMPNY